MPPGRQSQLSALTAAYPVTVRATRECGDGLFVTAACEADTLLISDVPLAWLPSSKQRLPTCAGCGACLGSAGALLARLAGDSAALALPHLDDAPATVAADDQSEHPSCGSECPRPQRPLALVHSSDELVLAAQLVARLAAEYGRATNGGTRRAARSIWQAPLEALAAPPWEEVCKAAGDAGDEVQLPQTSLDVVRRALAEAGCKHVDAVLDERLLSRAMGAVARNAIWVQVGHPPRPPHPPHFPRPPRPPHPL